ncbi:MAG: XdhC family protein [Phycisphaerae bacterium]
MSDSTNILDTIIREIDAGRRMALCVIVATRGSAPQVPGAMACVNEAGEMTGTVGGGMTEADVARQAQQLLFATPRVTGETHSTGGGGAWPSSRGHGQSSTENHAHAGSPEREHDVSMPPGASIPPGELFTFGLDHDCSGETDPICGGQMDVAITVLSDGNRIQPLREVVDRLRAGHPATVPIHVATLTGPVEYRLNLEAAPKLVIAGSGHVGRALAVITPPLRFRVSVIDDRSEFANAQRLPPPIEPVMGDITETLSRWPIDASTYIVIVTRGHKHDEQALGAVLDSPAKYLGMIGSRRKIKAVFDNLKQSGATQQQLDRVHSPIGLAIKAITPEEIAVSIAAELISVRRAEYRKAVEGPM